LQQAEAQDNKTVEESTAGRAESQGNDAANITDESTANFTENDGPLDFVGPEAQANETIREAFSDNASEDPAAEAQSNETIGEVLSDSASEDPAAEAQTQGNETVGEGPVGLVGPEAQANETIGNSTEAAEASETIGETLPIIDENADPAAEMQSVTSEQEGQEAQKPSAQATAAAAEDPLAQAGPSELQASEIN